MRDFVKIINGEISIDEDEDATGFETKANYFAGNYSVYDSKGAKYEKN